MCHLVAEPRSDSGIFDTAVFLNVMEECRRHRMVVEFQFGDRMGDG